MTEFALKNGAETPHQMLNQVFEMATEFYRLQQYSRARAYFQKAYYMAPKGLSALGPNSARRICKVNFDLADQAMRLSPQEQTWAFQETSSTEAERLSDLMTLEAPLDWTTGLGLFLMALWAFRALQIRGQSSRLNAYFRHFISSWSGGAVACLAFMWIFLVVVKSFGQLTRPASVLTPLIVRSGPGEQFFELARIPEGITVRRLDTNEISGPPEEIWEQIRYSSDGIGWVRTANLLIF